MVGLGGVDSKSPVAEAKKTKESDYGRTIGEPKLSDEAKKYYDQLKKKYGDFDFVLVSSDQMENAKANASKYANGFKTVVLIDEAKVEKMATDEDFRNKYEGILSGAKKQIDQLANSLGATNQNIKGFGIQVNDNGTLSYFAVLKDSSAKQMERIEEHRKQSKLEKKAAEKKASKEAKEERLNKHNKDVKEKEDDVVISSDSLEDLIKKIEDYNFTKLSDNVKTDAEKMLGQHIDFKG